MTDPVVEQINAILLERRRQGLDAEPAAMRAALSDDEALVIVVVLLTTGEALRFTFATGEALQGSLH